MEWYEKLVVLRERLGLKQGELALILGTSQKELSLLENGQKAFLPKWYLDYLLENGYDLNSLYIKKVKLSKIDNGSNELVPNTRLEKIDNTKLVDYLLEKTNILGSMVSEDDESYGELSLEERVKKLEAIMAIILMKLKVKKEELE